MPYSSFPAVRLRRLRKTPAIRNLMRETTLQPHDLILPLFITQGQGTEQEIPSLLGVCIRSLDKLAPQIDKALAKGVCHFFLFPRIPTAQKTADFKQALCEDNIICQAIRLLKSRYGAEICLYADVALDPFNPDGHDGIFEADVFNNGIVKNDETIEILQKQALLYAATGADALCPSDMMDGRIGVIRNILEENGYTDILLISYAAKFASALYYPFRQAVGASDLLKGDKKNYQMPIENADEALREIEQDIIEGADAVIVKPASFYLDIIAKAKAKFNIPIFAYHVSTEYAMLKLAEKAGIIDYQNTLYENLTAIKRAGTTGIITYGAMEV
jgi:porphobilinogen synthase